MSTGNHRLNHHDIAVLEAIKARHKVAADLNRRDDRVITLGAALCLVALVAMHFAGWLA